MAREPKVTIKIDGDASGYRRALQQSEKDSRTFSGRVKHTWAGIGAGIGGFADAASTAFGILQTAGSVALEFAQAAADEQQQYAKLTPTLRESLKLTQQQSDALLDTVSAMQYGSTFADDQLRPAFANLAAVTKDTTTATMLLQTAMDASVATGIPLETITKALAKAADGNTSSLGKLFPVLDQSALKSGNLSGIIDELTLAYGGSDKAASDTAAGGMQDLEDAYGDVQEAIGTQLLPYLRDFTDWATSPEGQQGIEDMANAIGDLASALATVWEWGEKINNFVPQGFLWRFRANPDDYWPDRWPWEKATGQAAPGGAATYAARPQGATPAILQVDGVTLARTVSRVQSTDQARGGSVRVRTWR